MASDSGLTRFLIGGVSHRDGQQFVDGKGLSGQSYSEIHRHEPHGFASHPVPGGIGLALQARGARDSAYVIGGENPALRPELPLGGSALYDHQGNIIKLIGGEAVFDFQNRTATLTAGTWTFNGAVTINAETGGVVMHGPFEINGPVKITGNVQLNGNLTATGSVVDGDGDGGA